MSVRWDGPPQPCVLEAAGHRGTVVLVTLLLLLALALAGAL